MLFKKLLESSIINNNPFEKIKMVKPESVSALYFDKSQIKILKEYISLNEPQLWLFIQFMFFCLIRPNELRRIRVGDIHENKLQIRGEISKNKNTDYVAIPKPLLKAVHDNNLLSYASNYYLFGKSLKPSPHGWSVNHFSRKHRDILKLLGFSNRHCLYSWKHTGAIYFYKEMKLDLNDMRLQLRHQKLDVVQEYFKGITITETGFAKNDFDEL